MLFLTFMHVFVSIRHDTPGPRKESLAGARWL